MKQTNLKKYFPVLRTRVEVQTEISGNPHLDAVFKSWEKEQQEEFLDFCSGAKGLRNISTFRLTFFEKLCIIGE